MPSDRSLHKLDGGFLRKWQVLGGSELANGLTGGALVGVINCLHTSVRVSSKQLSSSSGLLHQAREHKRLGGADSTGVACGQARGVVEPGSRVMWGGVVTHHVI